MLDCTCPEKRREQRLCCCPWMEAGGEEKQRQTQNNLASHCGKGERQTRMEHMDKSKTGCKQPPAVEEGGCPGLVHLLARRDLTYAVIHSKMHTLCHSIYFFIWIYEICIHVLETDYEKYFTLNVA